MAKLSVKAKPSFKATAHIPVAGGDDVPALFTFKHRTRAELKEFIETREGKSESETFLAMVDDWSEAVEGELNETNVATFLENYFGAAVSILQTYIDELTKAREKN